MQKNSDTQYRKLTPNEIATLTAQGCRSQDWNMVEVGGGFLTENISNCRFKGYVKIGNNVYINNIGSYIADTVILDGAYIENAGVIEYTGGSFGKGIKAEVINEGGGREVPLHTGLTAQTAYMAAIYRNRHEAIARFEAIVEEWNAADAVEHCIIGEGARITNCLILRDVLIGADAVIDGAAILSNGTIECYAGQKTFVGAGVKMYDFIMLGNSSIDNGAVLKKCFVSSAVRVSAAAAVDSVFFANAHCENGEFCHVFAGPYTVSHHRSTLLIAGMFSFFNAGSGMNRSNHLFKSGPVHQSIHRRGVKYGSGAYVMLPVFDGAFNTVIGKHKEHPDTEEFPYSYLMENDGASYLVPGLNLASCGTKRDIAKWQKRDIRDTFARDIINFEECNPFIAERILRGIAACEQLLAKEGPEVYIYKRMRIKATMLRHGLNLYRMAKDKFFGAMLEGGTAEIVPSGKTSLSTDGTGSWLDVAGMFMPRDIMAAILDMIEDGRLASVDDIVNEFKAAYDNYRAYAFRWALDALEKELGRKASAEDIASTVEKGRTAAAKLSQMSDEDARKERGILFATSYGLDAACEEERLADYHTVRGI